MLLYMGCFGTTRKRVLDTVCDVFRYPERVLDICLICSYYEEESVQTLLSM